MDPTAVDDAAVATVDAAEPKPIQMQVPVPPDLWKELKHLALDRGLPARRIVLEAIEDLVARAKQS